MGATRGIGRAIAETLAAEGCTLALCARNGEQVAERVADFESQGVKAMGMAVDIADSNALGAWVDRTALDMDGLDILVSNAGAMAIGNSADAWQRNMNVDILGAVAAVDAAMPHLKQSASKTGDAAIIAIGSVSAVSATEPSSYGAVKGALIHYIKGVAKQAAGDHVRANVVSPGTVYFEGGVWNMVEKDMPDLFKTTMARNPMRRMATPEDIANAATFLASPRSSFTTGINMIVDGALTDRANY